MWQRFSPDARASILRSQSIARSLQSEGVSAAHLFLALLETAEPNNSLGVLLLSAGLRREEARLYVEATIAPSPDFSEGMEPKLTSDAKRVLEFAASETVKAGDWFIGTEPLLLACLRPQEGSVLPATLAPLGWDLAALRAKRRTIKKALPVRDRENPLEMLTEASEAVIEGAYRAMRATYCGRISTAHLLLALLENEHAVELLGVAGTSVEDLRAKTRASIRSDGVPATVDKRFDKGAKRALDRAKGAAHERGNLFINPYHLLLGLLPQHATARERIEWGTQVPDESASLLRGVDSARIRQLLEPIPDSQAVRSRKGSVEGMSRDLSFQTFFVACLAGAILASPLSLSPRSPTPSLLQIIILILIFSLLLGSALGSCWMLVRSNKNHLTSAWISAFAGFLLGVMLTVVILAR